MQHNTLQASEPRNIFNVFTVYVYGSNVGASGLLHTEVRTPEPSVSKE